MHKATWRMPHEVASRIREVGAMGRARQFARGEQIYAQGDRADAFYLVERGFVRVAMLREDGSEVGLEIMGPETICGEGAVFDRMPRFSTATAITPVSAIGFSLEAVAAILRQKPEVGLDLLSVVAEKQRVLAVKLEHFASRDVTSRILELLTRQAILFGVDAGDGCLIRTRLTHEQIASLTGTSRVTVTRALRRLAAEGVISRSGGFYILRSGGAA